MTKVPVLYYNTVTLSYSQTAKINLDPRCNGVTVRNAGNINVIFDDEVILPGQSKTVGGNLGEIFIGRKDLYFGSSAGVTPPLVYLCYITQKFYVPRQPGDPDVMENI